MGSDSGGVATSERSHREESSLFQRQVTAGDKALQSLTLAANPVLTHLLLGRICLPLPLGGQSKPLQCNRRLLKGAGGGSPGIVLGSAKPCLGAQRRTAEREDSLPAQLLPRGEPYSGSGRKCQAFLQVLARCSEGRGCVPVPSPPHGPSGVQVPAAGPPPGVHTS